MFFACALAFLQRLPAHAARLGRGFESIAGEFVDDAPGFWRKHRGRIMILLVSAVTSGVMSYIGERLSGPL